MRFMTFSTVRAARLVAGLAGLFSLAACDGPNAFATQIPGSGSGTGPGQDTKAPVVDIQLPRGDSLSAKPLGDSVLVRVRVTDNTGVDSVRIQGIAERGDKLLGTDVVVARFATKSVALRSGVRDTTVTRYLIPVKSSVKELSKIIVTAFDAGGNITADTSKLILGGPDIRLENVTEGQSIQGGLGLTLRITAQDPQGLIQLRLEFSGAFNQTVVKTINPPVD